LSNQGRDYANAEEELANIARGTKKQWEGAFYLDGKERKLCILDTRQSGGKNSKKGEYPNERCKGFLSQTRT